MYTLLLIYFYNPQWNLKHNLRDLLYFNNKNGFFILLFIKPKLILARFNFSFKFVYEEFEDTKGVIRIRKSKDRQHNGQKKKDKMTNNDLQNIHIK